MLKTALCLAALAVTGAAPALADDLAVASTIASVTVYPAGATVARTASATLPAGASTVIIDDLPLEAETDSITVTGAADHPIAIASVETRVIPADAVEDPRRVALEKEIETLTDQLSAIDDRLGAIDGRRRFIERLIEATPEGFGKNLAEGSGDISQWATAAAAIGTGLDAVATESRAAALEQRALRRTLAERQAALAELPQPAGRLALRIALSAETPTTGTLSVSYRTPSARWLPTYDARLATGEDGAAPSVTIVRRAEVRQATGEDWDGVALTLSTAETAGGTAAPELSPLLVSLASPYDRAEEAAKSAPMMQAAPAPFDSLAADAAGGAPARYVEAAADFGDFRAEYRVPGRVSVESGKGARSLQIATEEAAASLAVRAAPMLSQTAFLQASFTSPEGAPFLAGSVALFRDGRFVGRGAMPFTPAGGEIDLGFGADDRVRVERAALERETGERGILASRRTDISRFRITVENLHTRPIAITVLDRVPYAEDDAVTITRLKEATPPSEENVDDRRGVMAWSATYAAGETREILNAYQVSWPADRAVISLD